MRPTVVTMRPTVVTLCGSTRFGAAFRLENARETLAGRIVLTVGCDLRGDTDLLVGMTDAERETVRARLDELHLRKIDLSDEILVLNVGGYVGASTAREIEYARQRGKTIRWLEPTAAYGSE